MKVTLETSTGPAGGRRNAGPLAPPGMAAFGLLELLIVFGLILVLSVMFYGSGSRSRQQTQKAACQKNLLKIYVALEIFANEHEGLFPNSAGAAFAEEPLGLLIPHYTVDSGSFICPSSKDSSLSSGEPLTKHRISYAYLMGRRLTDSQEVLMTDKQVNAQPKWAGQPVFSTNGEPPGNNHQKYGGNFLFGDGHVEMSDATAPFSLVWTQGVVLLNPKP